MAGLFRRPPYIARHHKRGPVPKGTQDLSLGLIDQTATISDPTVIQQQFYTPALIDQTAAIFDADITQGDPTELGTYVEEVTADSPIVWYRLGEPSGTTAVDEMDPSNEMDYVNTPTLGVAGLITDGDTAVTWSRASTEHAASGATMPAGSSVGVSIEGWAKFATVTASTVYPIARWWLNSPVAEAQFKWQQSSGSWRYFYQDATTTRAVTADAWTPTVGVTYHVVVTHDYSAETVSFYVNGTLLSTEDVSAFGVPVTHNANGFISVARAGSDYFDGTLDEVAIYNSVLSGTRILAHFNAGVGAYVAAVRADSPVGYWRMGEASGQVLDSIGSNHGTATGTTRNVTGAITDDDGAITFNGSSDVVRMGDVLDQTGAVSYELWIKRANTTGALQYLMSKGAGQPNVVLKADHYLNVGEENVDLINSSTAILNDTNWHHIVFTWTGVASAGQVKLYVDGVDVGVEATPAAISANSSSLSLGAAYVDALWFAGTIDEAAIYNTVLSPTRVLAHYNAGVGEAQSVTLGLIDQTATIHAISTISRTLPAAFINQTAAIHNATITTANAIAAGFINQTAAIHSPTITTGAVSASVGIINQTAQIGTPTITTGAVSVSPNLITQTAAIHAPTITTANAITVALINQTAAIHAATVSNLNTISVGLITQAAATFAPTITTGVVNVSVGLITQTAQIHSPTITTGNVNVTPNLITQTAATFTPTISTTNSITVALITQTAATFAPTVTVGAAAISIGLIDQTAATFTPTITTGNVNVTPNLISNEATASTPTVTTLNTISVGQISQAASAFSPSVSRTAPVNFINQTAQIHSPTVTAGAVNVSLGLITQTAATFAPTITTANTISVGLINQTAQIHTATVSNLNTISVAQINQAAASFAPTVTTGAVSASVGLINQTAQTFTPTITTGVVSVSPNLITQTATAQAPTVTTLNTIDVARIDQAAASFAPALNLTIFPNFINQVAVAFEPTTSAGGTVLELDLINQTASASAPTITTGAAPLSVGLINQTAQTFTPTITTANVISVGLITQSATAFAPSASTDIALGLITQTAAAFSPTITTANSISLGLITQTASPFAPTVDAGGAVVELDLIDQTATISAPTITTGAAPVSIGLIDQTAQAFSPTVTTSSAISVGIISQPASSFAPSVTTSSVIDVGLIDQAAVAYELTILTAGEQLIDLGIINQTAVAFGISVSGGVSQRPGGPGRWYGYGNLPYEPPLEFDQRLTLATIRAGTKAFSPSVDVSDDEVLLGLSEDDLLVLA